MSGEQTTRVRTYADGFRGTLDQLLNALRHPSGSKTDRLVKLAAAEELARRQVYGSDDHKPCPFCGGAVDPEGWLGTKPNPDAPCATGEEYRGPECEDCGATAPDMETWNRRTA